MRVAVRGTILFCERLGQFVALVAPVPDADAWRVRNNRQHAYMTGEEVAVALYRTKLDPSW